jgi:hypothetical protein
LIGAIWLLAVLSVISAPSAKADSVEANRTVAPATSKTSDGRWALIPAAEVAIAKPVGTAAMLFSTATDLRLSATAGRAGSRWRLSVSFWYRYTLDPAPADSVSFLGGWVHPELTFLRRMVGSIGVGWQWRRIEIEETVTSRGSLSAMSSLGVRFHPWRRIELTPIVRYDVSQPVAREEFRVQHLGLALSLALVPR